MSAKYQSPAHLQRGYDRQKNKQQVHEKQCLKQIPPSTPHQPIMLSTTPQKQTTPSQTKTNTLPPSHPTIHQSNITPPHSETKSQRPIHPSTKTVGTHPPTSKAVSHRAAPPRTCDLDPLHAQGKQPFHGRYFRMQPYRFASASLRNVPARHASQERRCCICGAVRPWRWRVANKGGRRVTCGLRRDMLRRCAVR